MKRFEFDDLEERIYPYHGPAVIGEAYDSGEWASIHIKKQHEEKEMNTLKTHI